MGLEPTRLYRHKILSLACLPIPALPQTTLQLPCHLDDFKIITKLDENVNIILKISQKNIIVHFCLQIHVTNEQQPFACNLTLSQHLQIINK